MQHQHKFCASVALSSLIHKLLRKQRAHECVRTLQAFTVTPGMSRVMNRQSAAVCSISALFELECCMQSASRLHADQTVSVCSLCKQHRAVSEVGRKPQCLTTRMAKRADTRQSIGTVSATFRTSGGPVMLSGHAAKKMQTPAQPWFEYIRVRT